MSALCTVKSMCSQWVKDIGDIALYQTCWHAHYVTIKGKMGRGIFGKPSKDCPDHAN